MIHILRARHLLCIIGNVQQWHSPSSYQQLQKLRTSLLQSPHQVIRLVDHCENICGACQHCVLNYCQKTDTSHHLYQEHDRRILSACSYQEDATYRVSELIRRYSVSLKSQDIKIICRDCEFATNCLISTLFRGTL